MFEQTFKNIDDVLRKEAGCTTELDYTEQTSWLLFLRYLDSLEKERQTKARLHRGISAKQLRFTRRKTRARPPSPRGIPGESSVQ